MNATEIILYNNLKTLIDFFLQILFYLIPCIFGSATGFFIRNNKPCDGSRSLKARQKIARIIKYAIVPTVLCVMLHPFVLKKINSINSVLGVAVLAGILGKDITNAIITLRNLFNIFISMSSILKNIKSGMTPEKIDSLLKLAENKEFIQSVANLSEALHAADDENKEDNSD